MKEVSDLYEFREVLELHSIAAAEITPMLLSQMAESIERTKMFLAAGNKLKHIEEDLRFHGMIATASGNAEFCRVFENIQQKSLLCGIRHTTCPGAHPRRVTGRSIRLLKLRTVRGEISDARTHPICKGSPSGVLRNE